MRGIGSFAPTDVTDWKIGTVEHVEPLPEGEADARHVCAVRAMMKLAHVTAKPGLKAACYRAAGQHLAALRHRRARAVWADMVQRYCPVSVSRAYELMAVAAGTKPVETLRMSTRVRRKRHYHKKSKG